MSESQMEDLTKLHQRLRERLDELTTLFDENQIKYYLGYGTLLGAARHNDIIPWDDDIDLMMFRSDYEKMIHLYRKNKIGNILLSCVETDPTSVNLFAKIVFRDESDREFKKYFTHPDGLCIDIFPLYEAYCKNNITQKILWFRIKSLRRAVSSKKKLLSKNNSEPVLKKFARAVYQIPFIPFSSRTLMKRAVNLCKKNEGRGLGNLVCYGSVYSLSKEIMPKSYWCGEDRLKIGSKEYRVPGEYKNILTNLYGKNWNQIPPQKQQYRHISSEQE